MKLSLDVNKISHGEIILRVAGFIFFFSFVLWRLHIIRQYGNDYMLRTSPAVFYAYRALWAAETLVFVIYAGAYLFRKPAKRLANGFMEVVFPFFVAGLPFLMIRQSFLVRLYPDKINPYQDITRILWNGRYMYVFQVNLSPLPLLVILFVMLIGTLIMLLALMKLWRSFSIMTEARSLVRDGIYKYIRHPLYVGEIISYLGVLLMRFSLVNVLIFLLFTACQVIRARIEERKLESIFPEYAEYKKTAY